jgi:glycerol kinase
MAKPGAVLAIDQGTTSSRAMVFGADLGVLGLAQREFAQHFPASGWVEHDPEDIWRTTVETARQALAAAGLGASDIAAIGITNQRETCVIWDRRTGRPIHRAIVWQDRRTTEACRNLKRAGHEPAVTTKTGLLLDPYFSATKIAWLLDHVEGARALAKAGHLAFGTIDSFLIWRLTGGKVHATDATNASRTLLYDIAKGAFDDDLLKLFDIPRSILPDVRDCNALFGVVEASILGGTIPILGVAGDQQAATIGQACFSPGMVKATYGTGCFALLNTGEKPVASHNRLLTTVAYQLDGKRTYALEGAIFIAGAAVQWLRDGLRIIASAPESGALAAKADPGQDVYLVPAFVGLGAPYWQPEARGALFGLTRATGSAELARAALEAVCYQTRDLLEAMHSDWSADRGTRPVLRVDGGMVASDWTMQFLADILDAPVERPTIGETTALGVAWLAGHKAGMWPDQEGFGKLWKLDRAFEPALAAAERERKYAGWKRAVRAVLGHAGSA